MNPTRTDLSGYNRRDFLKSGSFASLMTMMGGVELFAQSGQAPADEKPAEGGTINIAIIGLGWRGRDILAALAKSKSAKITALCDTYGVYLRRSGKVVPEAKQVPDYKVILDDNEIKAVV